jgi:hypothetical protein
MNGDPNNLASTSAPITQTIYWHHSVHDSGEYWTKHPHSPRNDRPSVDRGDELRNSQSLELDK